MIFNYKKHKEMWDFLYCYPQYNKVQAFRYLNYKRVINYCFACEAVKNQNKKPNCHKCPLDWTMYRSPEYNIPYNPYLKMVYGDEYQCNLSYYGMWHYEASLQKRRELAKIIRDLPTTENWYLFDKTYYVLLPYHNFLHLNKFPETDEAEKPEDAPEQAPDDSGNIPIPDDEEPDEDNPESFIPGQSEDSDNSDSGDYSDNSQSTE